MQWRSAGDLFDRLRRMVRALDLDYVDVRRIRCVRVIGSRAASRLKTAMMRARRGIRGR